MTSVATLERKYYYKTFRDGVYLGLLPTVKNDFSYTQDINTAGTDMVIEISQVLDVASMEVENITTETGDPITTEAGENITTERATEIIGSSSSGRLIASGNDIQVWEYSDDDPNGVLVFAGYVEKWRSNTDKDTMELTVVSYGKDLNDYIYGTNIYTLSISQLTKESFLDLGRADQIANFTAAGNTFTPGSSFTLSKIVLGLANGGDITPPSSSSVGVTLKVYSGNPLGSHTLLATVTVSVTSAYPAFVDTDFIMPTGISLTSGSLYYFEVNADDYAAIQITNSAPYVGGDFYFSRPSLSLQYLDTFDEAYFKIYSSTSVVSDAVFTSYDPAQMVRDAVTGYRSQGGVVNYDGSSVVNSGFTPSYTFRTATILEIINKALELAPSNYYWFVDPATQLLTFKAAESTATHKLIMGRHLQSFELESSIEDIVNVIYFTGGPTAAVNLLKLYTDTTSLGTNRRGMERLSDNRVVTANSGSADLIADNYFDGHGAEIFRSSVILPSTVYDIDSINVGDTVGFSGFNTFIDSLILQITRLRRTSNFVEIALGALPLNPNKYIDQINRDLNDEQTLQNPNAPS